MKHWVGIVITSIALAACGQTGPQFGEGSSPFPPSGAVDRKASVDGLVVGHRLMSAGQYELALKAYYRAAAEQGISPEVLASLGSANLELGRLGQAETLLRKAIEVDDAYIPAWNNLGVVLMATNRTAEAERVFKTAFALDSGKSDEIRENLQAALARKPDAGYTPFENNAYDLERRGRGQFVILRTS